MLFRDMLLLAARQRSSAAVTLDAATVAWAAAVVTAGGTVSNVRKSIVNTFIVQEKAAGNWALTDDYWGLWAESATQALVSLKQLRTATVTAAPTFTADAGYVFNGTSNYINTGFVPSTHAVSLSGTNQRLAVYERTSVNANTTSIGVLTSATVNMKLVAKTGTTIGGTLNSGTATFTINPTTGAGYSVISRSSGGTTMSAYKNGVQLTDFTGLTVGTTLPAFAICIGARNNAGTVDNFRASSAGFACVGAPLSASQEALQYANVQSWATSVGANV